MVPSAFSSKGRQTPLGEIAGVRVKHSNMNGSPEVSTPPLTTISQLPSCNSLTANCNAAKVLAQAASITQLLPPILKRLEIRPAITLPSKPGKAASLQGKYKLDKSLTILLILSSSILLSRNAFFQRGCCMRLFITPSNSCAEVAPRITLVLA